MDKAVLYRVRNEFGRILQSEFAEKIAPMGLGRPDCNMKFLGDLLVAETSPDQGKDYPFTIRQGFAKKQRV